MKKKFSIFYGMSRVKKKLLLYFILTAVVSISVSAEIILEFSAPTFRQAIAKSHLDEISQFVPEKYITEAAKKIDRDRISEPIVNLRNRMILLLIVISASIFGAFFLFTRDIVSPMEGMVEATRKIAEGDLTVTVPVKSEDEIGQIGRLINDMNINLQDMIMQIRQEIDRHMGQIIKASYRMGEVMNHRITSDVLETRRMRASDFRSILDLNRELVDLLESISSELFALQKFVNMYKIYTSQQDDAKTELDNIREPV